jgi:3-hydroxymyristoyl/3-hydroxydecanoyl-(acyl carrier protein) dehydratase
MAEVQMKSWSLPAEHPVFHGHFPGNPMVPGVMLLEWVMAEVAQRLARAPSTLRVREAKFFTPLAPTQIAGLRCELNERRCSFSIHSQEASIARGILEWDGDG